MIKNLFALAILPLLLISSFLSAELQYDIHDIDTLQTHSSEAIALNNQGQILGWYNIDGSKDGKQFFVRSRDGGFSEISSKWRGGKAIDWQYLTDGGEAYGFNNDDLYPILFMWSQQEDVVDLGILPGKEISAINNSGQVLIKSFEEHQDGKLYCRPIIWDKGKITKLKGLEGDLGIESEESYGFDMNNNGDVVGQSLTSLVYKNNVYYQIHAVKWVNGKAIDLHKSLPKATKSYAIAINDVGDTIIKDYPNRSFLLRNEGDIIAVTNDLDKMNFVYLYNHRYVKDQNNQHQHGVAIGSFNKTILDDHDSIWFQVFRIIKMNDNGEIIADGQTIYGESHAMLLTPSGSD